MKKVNILKNINNYIKRKIINPKNWNLEKSVKNIS